MSTYTTTKKDNVTTATFKVDGVEYRLSRGSGKHDPIEAFVNNEGKLRQTEIDKLPNSKRVEKILGTVFGITSIEAMVRARGLIQTIPLSTPRRHARN